MLLDDAQVVLDGVGPMPEWLRESGGMPLEWAFCHPWCATAPRSRYRISPPDPQFRDNPLVTVEGLRAYAGAPLVSHTGHVLGGLCGMDVRPHLFHPDDLVFLWELADEAVDRIEAESRDEALR